MKLQGNKYYQDFMKLRSFKHKWTQEVHGLSPWTAHHSVSKREPYYYDLKKQLMFGSEDDIGEAYWKAYNYIVGDIIEKNKGYIKPWKASKDAKEALNTVIKYYDPYKISDDVEGTTKSKQDQFLDWLTPENREMAKRVKKQYEFKLRNYMRIIRSSKHRNKWTAFPGI